MKKSVGFFINIGLVLIGMFLIYQYFQPEPNTTNRSDSIVASLKVQAFDEAFLTFQQVSLNEDELNLVKDELLLQLLRAKDELNEERLLSLKAFVDNSPVTFKTSFHMPILNNIQIYLDHLDLGYILDCHEESDRIILELRQYTTRFTESILPYYRNGLAQALNDAREHYNSAITLDLEACYSPINYLTVLESGLTFMNQILENPTVSNYNSLRDAYFEELSTYDEESSKLTQKASAIKSRLKTLNGYQERNQEKIDQLNP
jgi:hypothetical protein